MNRDNGKSILNKFSSIFTRPDPDHSEQRDQETAVLKLYRTLSGEDFDSENDAPGLDKEVNGHLKREISWGLTKENGETNVTGSREKQEMDTCEGDMDFGHANGTLLGTSSSSRDDVHGEIVWVTEVKAGNDMKKEEEDSKGNRASQSKESVEVRMTNLQECGDPTGTDPEDMATGHRHSVTSEEDVEDESIDTHLLSDGYTIHSNSPTACYKNNSSEVNTVDHTTTNRNQQQTLVSEEKVMTFVHRQEEPLDINNQHNDLHNKDTCYSRQKHALSQELAPEACIGDVVTVSPIETAGKFGAIGLPDAKTLLIILTKAELVSEELNTPPIVHKSSQEFTGQGKTGSRSNTTQDEDVLPDEPVTEEAEETQFKENKKSISQTATVSSPENTSKALNEADTHRHIMRSQIQITLETRAMEAPTSPAIEELTITNSTNHLDSPAEATSRSFSPQNGPPSPASSDSSTIRTTFSPGSPTDKSIQLPALFSGLRVLRKGVTGVEHDTVAQIRPGKGASGVPTERRGSFLNQLSQFLNLDHDKGDRMGQETMQEKGQETRQETRQEARQADPSQGAEAVSEATEEKKGEKKKEEREEEEEEKDIEEKENEEDSGEREAGEEKSEQDTAELTLPAVANPPKPSKESKPAASGAEAAFGAFKAFFTPRPLKREADLEALRRKIRSDKEALKAIFERASSKTPEKKGLTESKVCPIFPRCSVLLSVVHLNFHPK